MGTFLVMLCCYYGYKLPHPQAKANLEKSKQSVEAENEYLAAEVKDLTATYNESDKRRKQAESQLSEAQSRIAEDNAKLQELGNENDRLKVRWGRWVWGVVSGSAVVGEMVCGWGGGI